MRRNACGSLGKRVLRIARGVKISDAAKRDTRLRRAVSELPLKRRRRLPPPRARLKARTGLRIGTCVETQFLGLRPPTLFSGCWRVSTRQSALKKGDLSLYNRAN